MIDIVIPTKGNLDYLFKCLISIRDKTLTTSYCIYVCDTGSTHEELSIIKLFLRENFKKGQVVLLCYNYYNFAKINNSVVRDHCRSDFILLCNNDIELIDNCIDPMYRLITEESNIGTVGCKLLFEDMTIQHAGQYIQERNNNILIGHRGFRDGYQQYNTTDKVIGNTGGFMLTSREVFNKFMLNEHYIECLEDLEYNITLIINGYTNLYMGSVSAFHYESITRGKSKEANRRFSIDYKNTFLPFISNHISNSILKEFIYK